MLKISVKQSLGISPNTLLSLIWTLLFGNAFSTNRSLLNQIDQDVSGVKPRSTQDFVDIIIAENALIINAAIQSQTALTPSTMLTYVNDMQIIHEVSATFGN